MMRGLLGLLVAVSCSLTGCDGEPPASTANYSDLTPPPQIWPPRDEPFEVPGSAVVDRGKELLVTDRALLSGARSDAARPDAPWSFRHLVETLAKPGEASALVRAWLATWEAKTTSEAEGSLPLGARPDVRRVLTCPWLRLSPENGCDASCTQCASEIFDLSRAPFRLLAVVDRLDLAETTNGCELDAAEARFVFTATRPGEATPLALNVIFEYGVNGTDAGEPRSWHALGSLDGERYAAALESLTRSFTDRALGQHPMLKQLRTSENIGAATGTAYELRQFVLRDGRLDATALTNTPPDALNGTSALGDHLDQHGAQILSGDNAIQAAQRTATSSMPRSDLRWSAPSAPGLVVDLFGLSTCNGCHAGHRGDTLVVPFAHVGLDDRGETLLSRFLDNPDNREGDELAFRGRSLARRLEGRCGSPEASYGGRRGGGDLTLPKREVLRRVH